MVMYIKIEKLLIIIFVLAGLSSSAGLRAVLNYSIFNSPTKGPYIETYLSVDGSSATYTKLENGLFRCSIEVTMIFRKDTAIIDFDKYELFSSPVADTSDLYLDLLDQQRYFLPEGEYEFEILLSDLNSMDEPFSSVQPVIIKFESEKVCFSGIELIDSISVSENQNILTKCGYDIIPWVFYYYPAFKNKLIFYTEIYNTDKYFGLDGKFVLKCYLESFESGLTLSPYVFYKRAVSREIYPFINEYDISGLPTGNYKLVVEVRDKENNHITSNVLVFQRNNPNIKFDLSTLSDVDITKTFAGKIMSEDTLDGYIRSLAPRATQMEQVFIYKKLETSELEVKQRFFYHFWVQRDHYNPEIAWKEYNELVKIVDDRYSTQIHRGFDTDRGRVYLKYGPPNIITESYNEPASYPYEIWQYYKLGNNQSNKRFVFYTHDVTTNYFTLLHSDAIGEIQNYRWQIFLNQRWFDPYNIDIERVPDIYGGRVHDYYRNPR